MQNETAFSVTELVKEYDAERRVSYIDASVPRETNRRHPHAVGSREPAGGLLRRSPKRVTAADSSEVKGMRVALPELSLMRIVVVALSELAASSK